MLWIAVAAAAEPGVHGDRVIVRAREGVVLLPGDALAPGVYVERALGLPGLYVATVPAAPLAHLDAVRRHALVAEAGPDRAIALLGFDEEPSFDLQWALENQPSLGGTFDADVDATDAWAQGATGAGVLVAVVDTGVDLSHPELAPALWINAGEVPGNGVDDDENGYVDDVHGIDAANGTGDPQDHDGHGTMCAGVVAAQADGRTSVGLAPDVEILSIAIFDASGTGFATAAVDAFAYANAQGAQVISCSWTFGHSADPFVTEAMEAVQDAGGLVIAAAGNVPLDADVMGLHPASSNVDAVVAVGGSDRDDAIVLFTGRWGSAWGDEAVDLLAPAEGVLTTQPGRGYTEFSGTSAATPMVAAAAALVWSAAPELDNLSVKDVLLDAVDVTGSETVSGGRLNAGAAVRLAREGVPPLVVEIEPVTATRGEPVVLRSTGAEAYRWWFGDTGEIVDGATVTHTFEPGEWRVSVEGTSADGARGHAAAVVALPIPWLAGPEMALESGHAPPTYGAKGLALGEVTWSRLHFSRIDLHANGANAGDDTVSVLDANGRILWSISGEHEDLWTPALPGGDLVVEWILQDARSWGFAIDRVEVWAAALEPEPLPEPEPRRGCATAPGAPWGGLLGLLLVAVRSGRTCGSRPSGGASRRAPPRSPGRP